MTDVGADPNEIQGFPGTRKKIEFLFERSIIRKIQNLRYSKIRWFRITQEFKYSKIRMFEYSKKFRIKNSSAEPVIYRFTMFSKVLGMV